MGPRALPLTDIRRILVRFPNWLGDTVMAVPALRALRATAPAAELWCLGPWVDAILEGEPGVARRLDAPRSWRARLELARELRPATIDLALLLTNSFETALFGWLTGARWRLGYTGNGRAWLLTHPVAAATGRVHQVNAYLALLRPLGVAPPATAPTLHVVATRRAEARRLLGEIGVQPGDRMVAIQLGAAFGPSKLWGADRLAALATRLDERGVRAVFFGSASAVTLLRSVEAEMRTTACSLVGRDHPALLAALLAEFQALVAPDSGPAHVAAAVGVPVVALFGPTDPRLTAPVGDGHTSLWRQPVCAPCFQPICPIDHRCLASITVDEVADAVLNRLAERDGGKSRPRAP